MDDRQLCRARAHSHRLTRPLGSGTVAGTVAHCVALQAQDSTAACLQVRSRGGAASAAQVAAALERREVVGTWLMRGTLHMVAAADARWLLAVFGARNIAAGAGRRAQLGLTDEACARAVALLPDVVGDRIVSRAEAVAGLRARGVDVDPAGQAPAHLMGYAAATGVLCRGPELPGREPGYVLMDAWVPDTGPRPAPHEAVAELARRYLRAYTPAGPEDFAAWSGLGLVASRRAFAALGEQPADDKGPEEPEGVVRLLGMYDTYVLGYRDRSAMLDPAHARRVASGAGIIHPSVAVDGRLVGTWRVVRPRRKGERASADVDLFPGERVDGAALDAERADVVRFLGLG